MLFRVPGPKLAREETSRQPRKQTSSKEGLSYQTPSYAVFFISVFPRQILIYLLSRNLTTTVTFESLGYLWLTMHFLHGRRYLKRCVTNAISPKSKTRGAELFALVYQARFHCILYFLGKITIQIKF